MAKRSANGWISCLPGDVLIPPGAPTPWKEQLPTFFPRLGAELSPDSASPTFPVHSVWLKLTRSVSVTCNPRILTNTPYLTELLCGFKDIKHEKP